MQAMGNTLKLTKAEHQVLDRALQIMETMERWVGAESLCIKANLNRLDSVPSVVIGGVLACFNDCEATFDNESVSKG